MCSKQSTYKLRAHTGVHTKHVSKREHPIGAMEEVSRKVQKASTYSIGTLRAHKGAMHRMSAKASTPTGQ